MERIEKKYEETYTYYRAWDGKIFNKEEDCKRYEEGDSSRIRKKLKEFLLRKAAIFQIFSPFNVADEEDKALILKPRNHEDIETLNEYLSLDLFDGILHKKYNYVDDSYINKNVIILGSYNNHPYILEDMGKQLDDNLQCILHKEECDADYDEDEEKIIRNYRF